jgi:hypothetical protein
MERTSRLHSRSAAKALAAVGIVALVLCASASAKFAISIAANDTTPAVGQPLTIIVRS